MTQIMGQATTCPICGGSCLGWSPGANFNGAQYRCERCGNFRVEAAAQIPLSQSATNNARSVLSHAVRSGQHDGSVVDIGNAWVQSALKQKLPAPREQISNLISFLAQRQISADEPVRVHQKELAAWVGSAISNHEGELSWLVRQSETERYLGRHVILADGQYDLQLNFEGWEYFEQLRRASPARTHAFMALQFNNKPLQGLLDSHFREAVRQTGFELRVLTDSQEAGIIDNQIRAAIRNAAFVIADLSDGNNGAYFEAGFAEGIGLHVIYLCEQSVFAEKKTHFDTNHCVTIPWNLDDPNRAASLLKATIRASLPSEARMDD